MILLSNATSPKETIKNMDIQSSKALSDAQLIEDFNEFNYLFDKHSINPEHGIFTVCRLISEYDEDENIQTIRTPQSLIKDGKGNCVDCSTFIASFLKYNNIPFKYRIADYGNGWEHIYIVTENHVIDAVVGRNNFFTKNINNTFDVEVSASRYKDFKSVR